MGTVRNIVAGALLSTCLSVAAQPPQGINQSADGSVISGPAKAFSAVSLILGPQVIVKLQGIDPFPPGSSCTMPWGVAACEQAAIVTINRLVRKGAVRCKWGEDPMDGRGLPAGCLAGRTDIAAQLVLDGVAAASDSRYAEQQSAARAARRGYWASRR